MQMTDPEQEGFVMPEIDIQIDSCYITTPRRTLTIPPSSRAQHQKAQENGRSYPKHSRRFRVLLCYQRIVAHAELWGEYCWKNHDQQHA